MPLRPLVNEAVDMIGRWAEEGSDLEYFLNLSKSGLYVESRDIKALQGSKSPKLTLYYVSCGESKRRQLSLTKLLARLQPSAAAHIIRDHASRIVAEVTQPTWSVKIFHAETPEEEEEVGIAMANVYEECDFGSCMRRKGGINGTIYIYEKLKRHPIEVYASPDIALIALYDKNVSAYRARAIVNTVNKTFHKIYPADRTGINESWRERLLKWLYDNDYEHSYTSLQGARIRNIQEKINQSIRTIIPYIDVEGGVGVREAKKTRYITITKATSLDEDVHTIALNKTEGFGHWRKGHLCYECSSPIPDEEIVVGLNSNIVCESCRDENYIWSDRENCYLRYDESFSCSYCNETFVNNDGNEVIFVTDYHGVICNYCLEENEFQIVSRYSEGSFIPSIYERLHPAVGGPRICNHNHTSVNQYLGQEIEGKSGRQLLLDAQQRGIHTVEILTRHYAQKLIGIFTFNPEDAVWSLTREISARTNAVVIRESDNASVSTATAAATATNAGTPAEAFYTELEELENWVLGPIEVPDSVSLTNPAIQIEYGDDDDE